MNRFIAIVFAFFTIWCSAQTTKTEVLFKKDDYELTAKNKAKLNLIIQDLNSKNTKFKMLLVGHTDSDGSVAYNKKLSEQRTNEVYHYLVEQGVHPSAITINYFGEEKPKVDNSDEDNMQKNRRVEIFIKLVNPEPEIAPSPKSEEVIIPQRDCERDTTLVVDNTEITINICDFIDNQECILQTTEIRTVDEILEQDLTLTATNGQRLITGGMVRFADCDIKFSKPVKLKICLPEGFFRCNDSALLNDMNLYMATSNGTWRRLREPIVFVTTGKQICMEFTVTRGGMFNCDIPKKGDNLFNNKRSIKFIAPQGKKIKQLSVGTQCCNNPVIYGGRETRINGKENKGRVYLGNCCLESQVMVSVLFKGSKEAKVVRLQQLEKKGFRKTMFCEEAGKVEESGLINRWFIKSHLVFYRKYKLVE